LLFCLTDAPRDLVARVPLAHAGGSDKSSCIVPDPARSPLVPFRNKFSQSARENSKVKPGTSFAHHRSDYS